MFIYVQCVKENFPLAFGFLIDVEFDVDVEESAVLLFLTAFYIFGILIWFSKPSQIYG